MDQEQNTTNTMDDMTKCMVLSIYYHHWEKYEAQARVTGKNAVRLTMDKLDRGFHNYLCSSLSEDIVNKYPRSVESNLDYHRGSVEDDCISELEWQVDITPLVMEYDEEDVNHRETFRMMQRLLNIHTLNDLVDFLLENYGGSPRFDKPPLCRARRISRNCFPHWASMGSFRLTEQSPKIRVQDDLLHRVDAIVAL